VEGTGVRRGARRWSGEPEREGQEGGCANPQAPQASTQKEGAQGMGRES
jgi:hypothetical protein